MNIDEYGTIRYRQAQTHNQAGSSDGGFAVEYPYESKKHLHVHEKQGYFFHAKLKDYSERTCPYKLYSSGGLNRITEYSRYLPIHVPVYYIKCRY